MKKTVEFHDQAPVRAALQGKVLILDGIHKCERNVLPSLNNLLENREMNLDDGRLIVSHVKYAKLLQTNTREELKTKGIVSAHPDFFVLALAVPCPPFTSSGRSLDPPLRSRFQIKCVDVDVIDFKQDVDERLIQVASVLNSASELTQSFPGYPLGTLFANTELLKRFPQRSVYSVVVKSYPWLELNAEHEAIKAAKRMLFTGDGVVVASLSAATSNACLQSPEATMQQDDARRHNEAVKAVVASSSVATMRHPVARRRDEAKHVVVATPSSASATSTARLQTLDEMRQDVACGRDLLLYGPSGSGKSFMSKTLFPTNSLVFPMHRETTTRDLLMRRSTNAMGDTIWEPSPLVQAARTDQVVILDGVEKLEATVLSSLARFLQTRRLELPDGSRMELPQESTFRVLALATIDTKGGAGGYKKTATTMITPELANMLSIHALPKLTRDDLMQSVLRGPSHPTIQAVLQQVLKFAEALEMKDLGGKLSTRALLRVYKRLETLASKSSLTDLIPDARHDVQRALLEPILPQIQRDALNRLLDEYGLHHRHARKPNENAIRVTNTTLSIGSIDCARFPVQSNPELIPHVVFFDVEHHRAQLRDMLSDFVSGSKNFIMVGNQGVGKNKLADRLCELLNAEREYVQLHRDSTVPSLLGAPTLKNGKLIWQDSPLVKAAKHGRVLLVDEADKAPPEVVAVLKSLVEEDGNLLLGNGVRLVRSPTGNSDDVEIHPDFCVWILSNRPGYPFHGNNFFNSVGDAFSIHYVGNPDLQSELELLKSYAPDVDVELLHTLSKCFNDLRKLADKGLLNYPYSTREACNVAKHLQMFAEDGLVDVLRNVLDFDSYRPEVAKQLERVFQNNGVPFTFDQGVKEPKVEFAESRRLPEMIKKGETWNVK